MKFEGWYDNQQFTGEPVTVIKAGNTGEKNLYAKFSYKIVYNTNCEIDLNDEYYYPGTEKVLPTMSLYKLDFVGWYDNVNFEGNPITQIGANESGAKVYYARWVPENENVTYHFETNYSSHYFGFTAKYDGKTITGTNSENLILPAGKEVELTVSGMGGGVEVKLIDSNNEVINTFKLIDFGESEVYTFTPQAYQYTNKTTFLTVVMKSDYTFSGGATSVTVDNTLYRTSDASLEVNSNNEIIIRTLKERGDTVFFDVSSNYPSGETGVAYVKIYDAFGKLLYERDTLANQGYDTVAVHVPGGALQPSYNVTLVNNDADSCDELTSFDIGRSTALPIPKKADYIFEGWYLTSDFSGEKYTNIPKTTYEDVTFYAKWTQDLSQVFTVEASADDKYTFIAKRTVAVSSAILHYNTVDYNTIAGVHYVGKMGTLSFPIGVLEQEIKIDKIAEITTPYTYFTSVSEPRLCIRYYNETGTPESEAFSSLSSDLSQYIIDESYVNKVIGPALNISAKVTDDGTWKYFGGMYIDTLSQIKTALGNNTYNYLLSKGQDNSSFNLLADMNIWEEDDGYQHLKLSHSTSPTDAGFYEVKFEHVAGSKSSTKLHYTFPVMGNANTRFKNPVVGRNDCYITSQSKGFNDNEGYPFTLKQIIETPKVYAYFDASGDNADDWRFDSATYKLTPKDTIAPKVVSVASIYGDYDANAEVCISIVFNEIVKGSSEPIMINNNEFRCVYTNGSNTITYKGNLPEKTTGDYTIVLNGITDLNGNAIDTVTTQTITFYKN
jgi:uncharacterized repeat protein (TIGR02543 family)